MMSASSSARNRLPFTATQWQELEHQALIYKYIVSGVPIPPELIYSVKRSLDSSLASIFLPHQPSKLAFFYVIKKRHLQFLPFVFAFVNEINGFVFVTFGFQLGGAVFRWVLVEKQTQNQVGAEEQMVRNGDAQRMHTPTLNTVKGICTEAETVQESLWNSLPHHHHHHHHQQQQQNHSQPARHPSTTQLTRTLPISIQGLLVHGFLRTLPLITCFWPLQIKGAVFLNLSENRALCFFFVYRFVIFLSLWDCYRYLQSIRQRVDERVFFPETSGTTRSSQDYNCTNSSHGRYYCQPQLQNTDDNNTKPQQHFFVLGNDFRSIKIEKENETQKPLRHFFEEWPPKSTDSWLDLASTSSRLGNDQLKPQ
ncbi:uncharacterized protein LOC120001230 [Tripterygium wilfordii]|uniref:uncharacterized protein LOC120001230 n=1 Tax=Tripterygium wilfordii TaxID=458696 RepID=UPI0018F813D2|nr:uncharacterized protein LOC120001230 [Tripterygium wilfordii]